MLIFAELLAIVSLVTSVGATSGHHAHLKRQATTTTTATATLESTGIVSSAWWAGWHAPAFPLSRVSWNKYTHMQYAFAVTTPDPAVISLGPTDEVLLPQFVSAARKHGVKALLSIGGWTGSQYFSSNIGNARNRTAFVKSAANLIERYNLHGLDFDWEYPAKQGVGCNIINANDTSNFLLFLQDLRSAVGKDVILTAAVDVRGTFNGPDGSPSTELSGFAKVLDLIAIMNYDVKSTPEGGAGPNSPISDQCAPENTRYGSAISSVEAWIAAGIPTNQLLLGVPAHAKSYVLAASPTAANGTWPASIPSSPFPPYNPALQRLGDRWDGSGLNVCGDMEGPTGTFTYWGLVEEGFIRPDGTPAEGIQYRFDNCSQTPYVYNPRSGVYVSYNNPESFAIKGGYIHSTGLKGFAMWEAGGDLNDALLDAILNATQHGGPIPFSAAKPDAATATPPSVSAAEGEFLHALQVWRASVGVILAICALLVF